MLFVGITSNWVISRLVSVPCSEERLPLGRRKMKISKFSALNQRRAKRFRNNLGVEEKLPTPAQSVGAGGSVSPVFSMKRCISPSFHRSCLCSALTFTHEVVPCERPLAHLCLRGGVFDGVAVMYRMGSCHDTLTLAHLAQWVGSQLLDAQLSPLAAVIDFHLVLLLLRGSASP